MTPTIAINGATYRLDKTPRVGESMTVKLDEDGNLWRVDCSPIKMMVKADAPKDAE